MNNRLSCKRWRMKNTDRQSGTNYRTMYHRRRPILEAAFDVRTADALVTMWLRDEITIMRGGIVVRPGEQ